MVDHPFNSKLAFFHGGEWRRCCPESYKIRITVYLEHHRIIFKIFFFFSVCLDFRKERNELVWKVMLDAQSANATDVPVTALKRGHYLTFCSPPAPETN